MTKRQCAVCGDTCATNVRFKWRRLSDGKVFNICAMCAEEKGKVNETSVDNFQTKYTEAQVTAETQPRPHRGSVVKAYTRK